MLYLATYHSKPQWWRHSVVLCVFNCCQAVRTKWNPLLFDFSVSFLPQELQVVLLMQVTWVRWAYFSDDLLPVAGEPYAVYSIAEYPVNHTQQDLISS
jgi:hypothetical protein